MTNTEAVSTALNVDNPLDGGPLAETLQASGLLGLNGVSLEAVRSALESLYAPGAVDESERLVMERLVQLTLDYLPDNYSRVLEYMYLEGLTVKEISQRLDKGVIAVQSLLARARTAFRRGFKDLQQEIGRQPQLGTKS